MDNAILVFVSIKICGNKSTELKMIYYLLH